MRSPAYIAFEREFLNANSWAERKDGVPLELLDALEPNDRKLAEQTLIYRLSLWDDWPIRGLGHLRSQCALPRLRKMLLKAKGELRGAVALAIWQISHDPLMCDELLRLSRSEYTDDDNSWKTFTMIDVIHDLAHLPYPTAVARLEELKACPNYLVSYNAGYALGLRKTAYAADASFQPANAPKNTKK